MGKIIGIDLGTTNSCVAVLPRMKNENRLHAEGNICRHSLIVLTQKSSGKNAHLQGKRQGGMEYLCVL